MSTQFRVDRANKTIVPCGMTSLLYLGGSLQAAKRVFHTAEPGISNWGKLDPAYGVLLSKWHGQGLVGEYRILVEKWLK